MSGKRDAYVEKLKAQLDEWNAKIDQLEARGRKAKAGAKAEYERRAERLRARWKDVRTRADQIQTGAEHSWETLREGLEAAWKELRQGFEEARSSLGEESGRELDAPGGAGRLEAGPPGGGPGSASEPGGGRPGGGAGA